MTHVLHLELVRQTPQAFNLRFWWDNPDNPKVRVLPTTDISDLIQSAETDYYAPLPARLGEVGARLYRWLDGANRWLSLALQEKQNADGLVVLAIGLQEGLAHLPWESLHNGTQFLVEELNPPVLPVRWKNVTNPPLPPKNRSLQVLFMAASPENVQPQLDFEHEERSVLEATKLPTMNLLVEESGCLDNLKMMVTEREEGFFDAVHLTGHADHGPNHQPVFLLEDDQGNSKLATARDFARDLPYKPPLVFLSGCRTAQNPQQGSIRSLAEQLIESGFRNVLGWGRPVRDVEASLAARLLYERLAAGRSLPQAVHGAIVGLREANARDWHLLRWMAAGTILAGLVTPPAHPGRGNYRQPPVETQFLDPLTKKVRVAGRRGFVGRRRLLQRSLRLLRDPQPATIGLLLHGQGGRGKSSIAERLCDRLRDKYQPVVVIGLLDSSTLTQALSQTFLDQNLRQQLTDASLPLAYRLEWTLTSLEQQRMPPRLFVLDDFEQNLPGKEQGLMDLAPAAAATLQALMDALLKTGLGRIVITHRYALPPPFGDRLTAEMVPPFSSVEQDKQQRALDALREPKPLGPAAIPPNGVEAGLMAQGKTVAGGNPRLFEWIHKILTQPGLEAKAILDAMLAAEEKFRSDILAMRLVQVLPGSTRDLLSRLLLVRLPLPPRAVEALAPEWAAQAVAALQYPIGLGLVDRILVGGEFQYQVPSLLERGDPPPIPQVPLDDRQSLCARVFPVLYQDWWKVPGSASDTVLLELVRLATEAGYPREIVEMADVLSSRWMNAHRAEECKNFLIFCTAATHRHFLLLLNLARAERQLGNGDQAQTLLEEARDGCPAGNDKSLTEILFHLAHLYHAKGRVDEALEIYRKVAMVLDRLGDVRSRAVTLGKIADVLEDRGQLDEALRIRRDDVLPVFERLGDVRERAVTLGQIADVLQARGQLDEALRIRREEQLPVYERLGDVRSRAVTLGQIADVLQARGQLDEALRIRRDDVLPVFERLGDVRSRAVTLDKIADVLQARGQLDEALRIRRDDVLPVFERLGDVRSRAVTLGKIADVLQDRGQLDEALRIRREEQLPVYERLGDVRSRAVTLGQIADVLQARGQLDEALRIRREEQLPVFERLGDVRERAVTLGQIADVLQARGQLDEALRILRDDVLPVYERLGDVRSRAVTLGKIADVLQARGQLDEALRIRREEQLPVYERLGDVRAGAVTLGKIADVLQARGQLDEALRILREEQLPVFERLGDVRSRAVTLGKIADVLQARGQLDEALRIRRDDVLPVFERLGDVRERAVTLGKIADVLQARGQLDEALRIRRDDVLPVFERLGDVRELIVCRANLAFGLLSRGHPEDAPEAVDHLLWSYREAKAKGIAEAQQLEGILKQLAIHLD